MAKVCDVTHTDQLKETLSVKDVENVLGVSRRYTTQFIKERNICFQAGEGRKIYVNKNALLRVIGYQSLVLTPDLEKTPLVWGIPEIALYLGVAETTAYEYVRNPSCPIFHINTRKKVCREAFLIWSGYVEPPVEKNIAA